MVRNKLCRTLKYETQIWVVWLIQNSDHGFSESHTLLIVRRVNSRYRSQKWLQIKWLGSKQAMDLVGA